ncbi:DUF4302 and DUF4987 domain-containing protein [Prevotella herbatica]|uniref:DUF4302 and DUF4987 domain-containing protein n=2 Tax=Prevotella herbatica TaxID=2801997 RepID=A0ABN6EHP0_9BACT|nr:DUF4302 and DUF4987 domain-containing protein [Prevotella herbatica]
MKDQEDLFDEPSSLRMQNALDKTRKVLEGSKKGWLIDYYVGDNQQYGGYAFTVKFDSLTCTAASELSADSATSYYKLTTDDGPVLTFDTYNTVLHALATPSADNYEGFHADYEFIILSADANEVVLKGKKTGSIMKMYPLTETPSAYLSNVKSTIDNFVINGASGSVDKTSLDISVDIDNRQIEYYIKNDSTVLGSTAFTMTDKGVRLYDPIIVDGKKLQNFIFDADKTTLTCTDASNVTLKGTLPAGYFKYSDYAGDYSFTYSAPVSGKLTKLTMDVKLTPSGDGTTYKLDGLNSNFSPILKYNKSKGILELNSQVIGEYQGYNIWLCAWGIAAGGNLTWNTGAGMVLKYNSSLGAPGKLGFKWASNGYSGLTSDSFIMWLIDSNGKSAGGFVNPAWAVNGSNRFYYLDSLIKK